MKYLEKLDPVSIKTSGTSFNKMVRPLVARAIGRHGQRLTFIPCFGYGVGGGQFRRPDGRGGLCRVEADQAGLRFGEGDLVYHV